MMFFPQLRCLGALVIDLDEVPSNDDSSVTEVDEVGADFATIVDEDEDFSEAETVAGNPGNSDIVEVIDSDSSVEIIQVILAPKLLTPEEENAKMKCEEKQGYFLRLQHREACISDRLRSIADEAPKLLSPQEENVKMKGEERQGHFLLLQHREACISDRLRSIAEARNRETPEERRARRQRFREAVHGPSY